MILDSYAQKNTGVLMHAHWADTSSPGESYKCGEMVFAVGGRVFQSFGALATKARELFAHAEIHRGRDDENNAANRPFSASVYPLFMFYPGGVAAER